MKPKEEKETDWNLDKNEIPMANHYTKGMIDLLGYDIIKSTYDATLLYIEDAQKLSSELRTKGLQTAGLLITLIVTLTTGVCAVGNLFAKVVMIVLAIVLIRCLRGIFKGIILRKENVSRGNVQSNLLNQDMINTLYAANEKMRKSIFLASQLRSKEKAAQKLNEQTAKMQESFEKTTKAMITLITWTLYIASVFAIFFYFCLPVY